ncbi:MAG: hypothetical protein HKP20_08210 [Akkermansiaceae bacterium]|nr:hypothetical protein [Akkermansiaceae bacterium]
MKFPLDPGDVIGHGCWETVQRLLAPVSSIWIGCFCALASMFLAELVDLALSGSWSRVDDLLIEMAWALLYAPMAIFLSFWSLLVVPLLGYIFYQMIRSEHDVAWMWLGTTAVCGLMVMISPMLEDTTMVFKVVAWVVFVVLLVSIGVAIFFISGWQQNAQARHVQEVMAENERRRLEIEQQYGTTSFGQDNIQSMETPDEDK